MSTTTVTGNLQRTTANRRRVTKGYSAGRRAYDRRRRRHPLDHEGREFKRIVQHDPCSNPSCMEFTRGVALDADHIRPLTDGGENVWDNLGGLCHPCNTSKGKRRLLTFLLDG